MFSSPKRCFISTVECRGLFTREQLWRIHSKDDLLHYNHSFPVDYKDICMKWLWLHAGSCTVQLCHTSKQRETAIKTVALHTPSPTGFFTTWCLFSQNQSNSKVMWRMCAFNLCWSCLLSLSGVDNSSLNAAGGFWEKKKPNGNHNCCVRIWDNNDQFHIDSEWCMFSHTRFNVMAMIWKDDLWQQEVEPNSKEI